MRNRYTLAAALTLALAMTACSRTNDPAPVPVRTGSSRVALIMATQLPAIDHVTLTTTDGVTTVSQAMTPVDPTHFAATVDLLPAGTYTLTADAWADPADTTLVASGSASGVVITSGGTTSVLISMLEANPPTGPTVKIPQIDSLVASPSPVTAGGDVAVSVAAHSPEGHALTFLWADSCEGGAHGTFADPTATSTTWTSPTTSGFCELSVTVSDATNSTSVTAFIPIFVAEPALGAADVVAVLDTFPIVVVSTVDAFIVSSEPAPAGLSVGITANVVASASDPDGDAVTFLWTSNPECPGTFSPSATDASITFHTDDPNALCTLTLTVTDAQGNTVTATIVLTENLCLGVTCPPASDLCHVAGTCDKATGLCSAETPVTCPPASDVCHVAGTCDVSTGACGPETPVTCPAGLVCQVPAGCVDLCAGVTCTASDVCHVAGTCDPATGTCGPETPVTCPAGEVCDPANGQCTADLCVNVTCPPASDLCHVAGTCNPMTGVCSNETPVVCQAGQTCDLSSGQCVANCVLNPCPPASDVCHVAGTCDVGTGECSPETAVVCPAPQVCEVSAGGCVDKCAGVTCTATDLCHVAGTCNQSTGTCGPETVKFCPSGTVCSPFDGKCHLLPPPHPKAGVRSAGR